MKAPYRYSLTDSNGKYLYCNQAGQVELPSDTPKYLDYSPIDWSELKITYERNMENFGVFRTYTLPLTFPKTTATLLRDIFARHGYEAVTMFHIETLNTEIQDYEPLASAEIDYTQFHGVWNNETEPFTVKINLMDNSLSEFIKANENLQQEIPIDGRIGGLTLTIDGIERKNAARWLVSDGLFTEGNTNPAPGHSLNATIVTVDGDNKNDVKDVTWKRSSLITDFINDGKYIYKATATRTIEFAYNITVHIGSVSGFSYVLGKAPVYVIQKWDGSTVTVVHTIRDFTGTSFLDQTHNLSGTVSLNASVGDEFYISVFIQPTPLANEWMNFNYDPASWITLKYYDRLPASTAGGMRYHDVYKNLIEIQSGGKYTLQSNFLFQPLTSYNSQPYYAVLSPAESIKGRAGAKIKVSMDELRKFGRTNWMLAHGIEGNKLRVEPLDYFFKKDDVILTLDNWEKNSFQFSVARDMLYSGVRVGYEPQTYDGINGADEFNTLQQYKFPVNRVGTILDLVSPIRADIHGIEQARQAQFIYTDSNGLKETATPQQDDTLFAIETDNSFNIKRWSGTVSQNEALLTTYNTGFSPKRGLLRNLPHIYSIMPRDYFTSPVPASYANDEIRLTATANQGNLRTQFSGSPVIIENDSVNLSYNSFKPARALFKPIYFEFNCEVEDNFLKLIYQKPYGVIRFKIPQPYPPYPARYFTGFIVSVEVVTHAKKLYHWKLLSSPDNDLSLLVKMQ